MGQVVSHYEAVSEQTRLLNGVGLLEFERSRQILQAALPPPPALILDIGGAAGIYSAWLATLGYQPLLLDLVHKHAAAARSAGLAAVQGDARSLPHPDACCDAVLLMGPLYHLTEFPCRVKALMEARRVLRPGGVVIAAAICRYASLMAALSYGFLDHLQFESILWRPLEDGQYRNPQDDPLFFTTAFFHLPAQLQEEMQQAGLAVEDLLAVEGPCWLARDFDRLWADEAQKARLLGIAKRLERDPAMLNLSAHLLAIGRRTQPDDPDGDSSNPCVTPPGHAPPAAPARPVPAAARKTGCIRG